jgi:hypothetical protein
VTVMLKEQPAAFSSSDRALRVRQEVWQSLISMLRVYAHAASLNRGEVTVIETTPHSALLEHKDHALLLSFDARNGEGSFHPPTSHSPKLKKLPGGFTILEDGALRVAGEETQLDEAAIGWVEQLIRAAAGEERC